MAGFFRDAGQFLGNTGKSVADIGLSTFGADNVIQDSAYNGYGATDFKNIADVGGQITKTAAPIAAGLIGGPGAAMAVQGAQQLGGSFNPTGSSSQPMAATTSPNPYYNSTNTAPPMQYAENYAHGGYVKGKLRGYAEGDFVGPYNMDYTQGQAPAFNPGTPTNGLYGPYASGYGLQTPSLSGVTKASGLNPYVAAGTLALGAFQTLQGYRGLNRLQKEAMPTNTATPQLEQAYNRAQQASQRGYTPEQEAAFKNNLATNQNTAYTNAVNQSGGNLAQAINAGLQSQNINALNQFAADDASKKQQNIQYADSFAPRFQNIQDENTRNALNYRMMREQALGQAVSQGQTNLATGLNAGLASIYKG